MKLQVTPVIVTLLYVLLVVAVGVLLAIGTVTKEGIT